jgi:Fe-S-cluster containining protein
MFELDVQPAFGRLQGRLQLPARPIRLAELAWHSMQIEEQLVAMSVRRDLKDGTRSISCAKGCGACCKQVVPLSPPEAFMVAELVRSLPPDRRTVVLERFQRARDTLVAKGFGARSTDSNATPEELFAIAADYFDLGIDCPFLEEQACSIHPQRPSICREFLVTSPAILCSDLRKNQRETRSIPMAASMSECLSKLTARLLGGEPHVVPLTSALDWALENAELGKRTWEPDVLMKGLVELINQTKKIRSQ